MSLDSEARVAAESALPRRTEEYAVAVRPLRCLVGLAALLTVFGLVSPARAQDDSDSDQNVPSSTGGEQDSPALRFPGADNAAVDEPPPHHRVSPGNEVALSDEAAPSIGSPPTDEVTPPSRFELDAAGPAGVAGIQAREDRGPIQYVLEHIRIEGNDLTQDYVVRRFIPLEPGAVLDVDDPDIEAIRWRLLGTGFFESVELRLQRGSRRGWVDLVVRVKERNTLLIQRLAVGLSQSVANSDDRSSDLLPYLGIAAAETNLLGLGMELSLSGFVSRRQQGVRVRFNDPAFLASRFQVGVTGFFNDGLEFFGNNPLVAVECPEMVDPDDECPPEVEARNAVVLYRRFGAGLGMGYDLGTSTALRLDWFGEFVDVGVRPDAASETRGLDVDPIDFAIDDGLSFVSTLRLGLLFDRRDDPSLTMEGTLLRFNGMVGTRVIGSDYSFLRIEATARGWVPLPGARHRLRFGAFAGVIFGQAPFFHRFYASDLSDLVPSRVLLMNIDDRAPPNLLGTAIAEMRNEELAARIDVEYAIRLLESGHGIRALEAYASVGVYALADRRDLVVSIPGYGGLARIPIDLTFDLGLRIETSVGLFQLGFSNLIGFVPVFSP